MTELKADGTNYSCSQLDINDNRTWDQQGVIFWSLQNYDDEFA